MNEDWKPQQRVHIGDPRTPAELAEAQAMRERPYRARAVEEAAAAVRYVTDLDARRAQALRDSHRA